MSNTLQFKNQPKGPTIDVSKAVDLSKTKDTVSIMPLKIEWDKIENIEDLKNFIKLLLVFQIGSFEAFPIRSEMKAVFDETSPIAKYCREMSPEEMDRIS